MDAKEVLERAKKLIENPVNWIKHANARDAHGYAVNARSEDAVCFCMMGALFHAGSLGIDDPYWALRAVLHEGIVEWNDHPNRTHAEVLAAFDRAIAAS